jgi:O-antigen/teichoic acid export membrane protein
VSEIKMETTAKRVAKNTLWLFSQAIVGRLLSFILIIYLARKLGDLNFGKFSFANAFVQIFIIIADLGVSFLIIREVARDRENVDKYLSNGFFIKVILSLLTFGIIFILANILKCPSDTKVIIYLIGLCNILESLGNLFGSIFNAFEQMKYLFLTEIIEKVFLVLLCFIFLSVGYGLITVAFLYFLSGVLYLALNIILLLRNIGKLSFRLDIGFALGLFRKSLPFALGGLLLMFYYYIDAVMLGKMKGEQVVGWYSAGYQLCIALGIISSVFLTAVFPVMSRLFESSIDSLRNVYEKCFKYLLALGIPISIGGVILGKRIIFLFYGNSYLHSVLPFQLIAAVIAFSYINSLLGYFLTSVDRLNDKNMIFAISALINVALNFLLIPRYSYAGAAIATVASEILFCILCLSYTSRHFFHFLPLGLILKSLFASVIMGIFIRLSKNINLFLLILFGALIYFILLWFLGYFDKEDKLLFREVIGSHG